MPAAIDVKKLKLWNIYCCEHYSAKIWDLAGKSLTLALSHHSGEYIPAVVLTPLETVFNPLSADKLFAEFFREN
jgi:hypothetical protein